ncbi:hypothetical protein AVEN_171751-1, partial [Araneus ventricosus]
EYKTRSDESGTVVLPSGRSLRFLMTVDGRRNLPYHCMAVHCCAVDSTVDVDSTHNLSLLWGIHVTAFLALLHSNTRHRQPLYVRGAHANRGPTANFETFRFRHKHFRLEKSFE